MHFKRISDLHPASEYVLESLWVEVSQSMSGEAGNFTPSHSNPKRLVDIDKTTPITSYEDLSTTSAFVSKKTSLAEIFNNVTNISAEYADFSFITSFHIEGKDRQSDGDGHRFCFNMPYTGNPDAPHISGDVNKDGIIPDINNWVLKPTPRTSDTLITATTAIAAANYSAVTIEDTGLTAKTLHAAYQFSVNYIEKDDNADGDIGQGISANSTGITANNIYVPGEAILTAAAAYWADLAELYESDAHYTPGTLVKFGGVDEITLAVTKANAVVTENPAYLMNTKLRDRGINFPIGIALSGRSKIRVIGPVKKFDRLVLSKAHPGVACVKPEIWSVGDDPIIGIALATNLDKQEKCVEAVLQLTF